MARIRQRSLIGRGGCILCTHIKNKKNHDLKSSKIRENRDYFLWSTRTAELSENRHSNHKSSWRVNLHGPFYNTWNPKKPNNTNKRNWSSQVRGELCPSSWHQSQTVQQENPEEFVMWVSTPFIMIFCLICIISSELNRILEGESMSGSEPADSRGRTRDCPNVHLSPFCHDLLSKGSFIIFNSFDIFDS